MKTLFSIAIVPLTLFLAVGCGKSNIEESECHDNIDNDEDGMIDCLDADCIVSGACGEDTSVPTAVEYCSPCVGESDGWLQVVIGNDTACARHESGEVVCWGERGDNQTRVPADDFTHIATAGSHSCGVREDLSAACWGENDYGKASSAAGEFTHVAVGKFHSCGLQTDGELACWGVAAAGNTDAPDGPWSRAMRGTTTPVLEIPLVKSPAGVQILKARRPRLMANSLRFQRGAHTPVE